MLLLLRLLVLVDGLNGSTSLQLEVPLMLSFDYEFPYLVVRHALCMRSQSLTNHLNVIGRNLSDARLKVLLRHERLRPAREVMISTSVGVSPMLG